ncbi:MAG: arginine repressor [Candidatus Dormibacteria bacterium]
MSSAPALRLTTKLERQHAILDLIRTRTVRTQDDIVGALHERHLDVTQATISRDIKELGLARVHDPDGLRYVATEAGESSASSRLRAVMREHVRSIEFIAHLGVVRTRPSTAPLVAALVDQAHFDEIAGTIAGDDTILIVLRTQEAAQRLAERLRGEEEIPE